MSLSTDSSMRMLPAERRAVLFLALIYAVRMIGLFIMLPVLVLYGATLDEARPELLGLAMGIYGLTQALLQIPYGIWSDRYGRRRIITAGLLVFAGGSLLAAHADTVYGLILGRALQGAGAIAGVVMALASDLTRPNQRSKAMAVIGVSIGASFLFSIVLGPLLYSFIGGAGIFYLVAALALVAIGFLYGGVPEVRSVTRAESPGIFSGAVMSPGLFGIYSGIFILHAVLTANFSVLPLILQDSLGLPPERHWPIYLLTMAGGVLIMVPGLLYAERSGRIKTFVTAAAVLLAVSQVGIIALYGYTLTPYGLGGLLLVFFAAFNSLEAVLPSLVSKTVPAAHKGAALGAYSTCQFLGSFIGGLAAGLALKIGGHQGVFVASLLMSLLWLPAAARVKAPGKYECYAIKLDARSKDLLGKLKDVAGVREVNVLEKEGMVYVHVDKKAFDLAAFNRYSATVLRKTGMARGINKVILIGHLGQDPEVKYMPSGSAVANVSIATTESWKDKNTGEKQDRTEWHRVVFFARLAEIVGEYLRKGSQVYVEGRLQTRKWQDKNGQDRYTTEIIATEMQMLGGRGGGSGSADFSSSNEAPAGGMSEAGGRDAGFDDDIPF